VELTVVVEIPKGSRNKYEYDKEKGYFRLDRVLHSPVHYPVDYGYFENTLGSDADPLDALVLISEPTFPGCHINARPIGVLQMTDDKGEDQKILCVPTCDPFWHHIQELDQIPPHLLKEIEHFFNVYKVLENKKTHVEGWKDRKEAERIIKEAQDRIK
jgi:inorganic pyrophosphatase